jgi:two-component system, NtrC family, nitrogen regulation response regulator NtrX
VPSVLIVDDEPNIRRMVGALLTSEGYEVREAPDGARGVALATEAEPDVALVDLMMPGGMDGMAVLAALRERTPELPVVMMSGRAGLSDAVHATKLGAFNFLEKPLTPEGVLLALSSALELRHARREARVLRADLGLAGEMIGQSPALRRVREMIARVAPSDARVLITGESGTGKELVAAAIHAGGARKDRPFIRVNCAAIPRDLVESEMFGHERGAFTASSWQTAARCSWTRLVTSVPRPKRSCCGRSSPVRSSASAAENPFGSTFASSRQRTRTSRALSRTARSVRTCSFG